jgi:hypothetical protein
MVHMTQFETYKYEYVVLGCELLSEFRRNGSSGRMQQMLINDSNGFVWLSAEDYRGRIDADKVYHIQFGDYCEGGYFAPYFSLSKPEKFVNRWIHEDRFPNAIPEIRDAHRVDTVVRGLEYDPMGATENVSTYDGCDKPSFP